MHSGWRHRKERYQILERWSCSIFSTHSSLPPETERWCRRVTSGLSMTRAQSVRERRSALQLLRMTIISAPDELRDLTRMQLIRLLAA